METPTPTIEALLGSGQWAAARARIEAELASQPGDHWLLTQLGVTLYEQGRYAESLRPLVQSLEIVPDCPLTLWNLAGGLDALGKPEDAVAIYTWLIGRKKTAADDDCWESDEWADALKTDCVYRVGACFERMGLSESAERCFRQYVNLLLAGMAGSYTLEDAGAHIQKLHSVARGTRERVVREAFGTTLQDAAVRSIRGRRRKPPKFTLADLVT